MEPNNTILVATGTSLDVAALELALATHQYRVESVTSGDHALQVAAGGGVALVLLDTALAGSAALELTGQLTQADANRRIPVLLMSHRPSQEEQQRAARAGADGYFSLPLATTSVVDHVLFALQGQRIGGFDLEVNYHMMAASSPDAVMLIDMDSGHPVDLNHRAEQLLGRNALELLTAPLSALCDQAELNVMMQSVLAGELKVHRIAFRHSSGRPVDCNVRGVRIAKPGRRLFHIRMVDVTGTQRAEALRVGQEQLLEMMARGVPLDDTLHKLVRLVESQSPGVLCSVMLLAADGQHMHCACCPSLPAAYAALLEGLAIGPGVGSCGTAMHRREAVVVSDIENDPLWAPYAEQVREYGLRACWSMPIMQDEHTVLGSFAMYYRTVRHPDADEQRLIGVASHLASIAIERARREVELERHRSHLEELVEARTAELTRAKQHAELTNEELQAALENLSLTQEELVRRDKLAALGSLVAGVAHELNTPIGNSLVTASTLADQTASLSGQIDAGIRRSELDAYLERAREAGDIIQRNLQRAAKLVASFKEIAVDTTDAQRRRFFLDELLQDMLAPLWASLPQPRPNLVLDVVPGLQLDSYPGSLSQALAHLVDNCIVHAFSTAPGGEPTVTITASAQGSDVLLSVADNGAGIAAEHLRRVFDPFFTTRLGAGQSGLGLYITHNIVTGVLAGHITAASTPGCGSTFTIRLPAAAPL
ncbi:ATP-binding protein [Pseudoduganella violaceinigra]|uniref:ATP-binding protein n=1 Tax=Pseudoduganella violaceinigra TaxID=246602 RepID=UPI000409B0D6|nr:ATP-binding protein [Pseudoduganella violaceinigra]